MKARIIFVFFCCLSVQISFSQVLKEVAPESAGVSPERLQRIDKVLQEYVDKKWMGGASAIIAHNGKIVYYKAIGYHDAENKTKLKRDDIFRIAS